MAESIKNLTSRELVSRLSALRGQENAVVAKMVRYLSEVDSRGLYLDLGYSSLFAFCREKLGYSEDAAFKREQAACMLKTNPELFEMIEWGEISLCSVAEISKVEDVSKYSQLLARAVGMTKEEVRLMTTEGLSFSEGNESKPLPQVEAKTNIKISNFTMEVDDEFMRLYKEAKELIGNVTASDFMRDALKEYIEKRKTSLRHVKATPEKNSRFITKSTRLMIFERDNHQCTFVSEDGKRCTERHGLEIEHIQPFALKGTNGTEKLRLLCKAHNQLLAEKSFGKEKILEDSRLN